MVDIIVTKEEIEATATKAQEVATTLRAWAARDVTGGGGDTGGGGSGELVVSPTTAKSGDTVTVTRDGGGFGATSGTVHISYWPGDVVSWNDNQIVFKVGANTPPGGYNLYINGVWLGGSIIVIDASGTGGGDTGGGDIGGGGDTTSSITSVSRTSATDLQSRQSEFLS